jgi:7SK snRNA methylphosphate capping enzyme
MTDKNCAAQLWCASKVLGVDIDDSLIRGAWRRRRSVWSSQSPGDETTPVLSVHDAEERPRKRLCEEPGGSVPNYFPASLEHTFGPLSIPPSQIRGRHAFPHNVSFRAADWVNNEILEDKDHYDVVIASVTARQIY